LPYDNIKIANPVQRRRDIALMKQCPPAKEVYTSVIPKKVNILD